MLRSKISMSVSAALLLGMVSITGCGTGNTANDNNVQTKNVRGTHDGRLGVNSVQGVRANAFDKMEMSEELADRIAAMPEVRSANVMVAGKSAYVAVVMDEASGGVHAKSGGNTTRMNNYNGTGSPTGMVAGSGRTLGRTTTGITGMNDTRGSRNGVLGMTGVGGSMTGIPGSLSTGTGTVGGTGTANPGAYAGNGGNGIMSGNNMTDGRVLRRDIDRSMGTAAGTRTITNGTNGMGNGTDGMTNGTNGNGINTLANDTVTQDMKDKIAAEVKKYNKNIDNVYVSANPDFVDRANFYAQEFRAGHPLKGFAQEFGTMVERIFPARSGY